MTIPRKLVLGLVLAFATAAHASATDWTVLRNDPRVHNELLGASIAYLIDEGCPSLKLRKITLAGKAIGLQTYARSLGYSGAETKAYVNSKAEQDRFRAIAQPYIESQGAVKGDPASYCAVGRAEMQRGTFAGSLLKDG